MIEIRHYVNRVGKDVFADWLTQLGDARADAKIAIRINRLDRREFWRLQVAASGFVRATDRLGPGYRVYYGMIGSDCVLLLCGGDKRKQSTDIERALEYLKDYKERTGTS